MAKELFEDKAKRDPGNYRDLSEPRPIADTQKSLEEFWEEFYELRNKHRLADVAMVVSTPCIYESGEEGDCSVMLQAGDIDKAESLFAMGYGQAVGRRQERIGKLLKGFVKSHSKK